MVRAYRVHLGVHVAVVQPPLYVVVLLTARRVILMADQRITVVTRPRRVRVIKSAPKPVREMIHRHVRLMRHVHIIHRTHIQGPSIMVEVVAQPQANVR